MGTQPTSKEHWRRRGIAIGGVVVLALVGVALLSWSEGTSHDSRPRVTATSTATAANADEQAVQAAVDRFVEALGTGDLQTLYDLQTDEYKRACPLGDFRAMEERSSHPALSGPARVAVDGDAAGVRLYAGAEPNKTPVVVPFRRQVDGSWRVVAQATSGCAATR